MARSGEAHYDPSPAVLRILAKTFAGPNAWKTPAWPEADAMDRAVAAGVMFREPRTLDHDGWVAAARATAGRVSAEEAGGAFLASLTSGRMDLRSALGSYAVARFLPAHASEPMPTHSNRCGTCGMHPQRARPQDLNTLNHRRFAGGAAAGRDDVTYIAFDLEQFLRAPRLAPTPADVSLGRQIIGYLRDLPPATTAAQAAAGLKIVRGNQYVREALLTILGFCGVLASPAHPGFADGFIPYRDRDSPGQRYLFGRYPLWWWRASDGVNDVALEELLPKLI